MDKAAYEVSVEKGRLKSDGWPSSNQDVLRYSTNMDSYMKNRLEWRRRAAWSASFPSSKLHLVYPVFGRKNVRPGSATAATLKISSVKHISIELCMPFEVSIKSQSLRKTQPMDEENTNEPLALGWNKKTRKIPNNITEMAFITPRLHYRASAALVPPHFNPNNEGTKCMTAIKERVNENEGPHWKWVQEVCVPDWRI